MIVNSKNKGRKIDYTEKDTTVIFGQNELSIDLEAYQEEEPVHLTICFTKTGRLTLGNDGITYVAEIDIPAIQYQETPDPEDEGGTIVERLPLDMNVVELTLWALEEEETANEQ